MGSPQKILAVFASPRAGGLSSSIHRAFLRPLRGRAFINEINVYSPLLSPCSACGTCRGVPVCGEDSVMNSYYPHIRESDIISFSFPVYFSSLPGPLKNFIDRCQLLWEESKRGAEFKRKKGLVFCTAGSEYKDVFVPSLTVMRHFFNTVNAEFLNESSIMISGTDTKNVINQDILDLAERIAGKIADEPDN